MRLCSLTRLLALAAVSVGAASPVLAQGLAKSGSIPFDQAREQKVQREVKASSGFEATLFAGPPYAMYPTCITATNEGALFVCQDPNLSLSVDRNKGRVLKLVDADGDGHAERYSIFVDSIDSPRGVAWDGAALYVMHPPMLTKYIDDNGDGISDRSEDLVEGLGFDLDFRGADHGTNQIAMGIDGWIYIAVGDYGYKKAIGRDGTQIEHHGGSVVRVRPDGTGLEIYAVGTRNIYDVALDPFMHVFSRDNTNDGDGWNTRLHYLAHNANMGYPMLYKNFEDEHFPSLHDYGAGSGTGDLWVQDPGFPAGFNNTLYTADWTVNKIFRHPLEQKGASFGVQQEEVLSVVHPSDLVMDGKSNMYVASLSGGQFTYTGDSVGYVIRVSYPGQKAQTALDLEKASDAQLLTSLVSGNAMHRISAQHEILRRGAKPATVQKLGQQVLDTKLAPESRAAAIFTLKQLVGLKAQPVLLQAASAAEPRVREVALRALVDRRDELAGVPTALYVKALSDSDGQVQSQAVNGLVRLGDAAAADALVPLAGSSDPALAHLAINALVGFRATPALLKGLDFGPPAVKKGALRALQQIHDEPTVAALVERARAAKTDEARRPLLLALARLYNEEGIWIGQWWTTRPSFLGPYFEPAPWEGSPRIRPVLEQALVNASGAEFESLVDSFVLNRVLPQGAKPLLVALTTSRDPQRAEAIASLIGSSNVNAASVPLLAQLDRKNLALHGAVAQLLASEPKLSAEMIPLVRNAALDAKLDAEVRGQVLRGLSQLPGAEGLAASTAVFAQLNPEVGAQSDVVSAWRRFVGDRRRFGELDYFENLARTGTPSERVLGYSVLAQINRAGRVPPAVKERVGKAIEAGWSDPASAPSLAQAVQIMGVESQYTDQLKNFQAKGGATK
jgi:putative membrane-bound dehydrogenase-like protein